MSPLRKSLSFAALVCFAGMTHADPPKVKIEYNPRQDMLCSLLPGSAIKDEWKLELASRKTEFERLWESDASRLFEATEAIAGKAFPAQDITARLTLCSTPSESLPGADHVAVNMRFALKSFTAKPVPMRYKANTLFHELLHVLLFKYSVANSSLLKEHAAEPERVRNHLHLLALQKAVLLKINELDALKEVVVIDSELPGGHYKRAWEIVNATDVTYLKYVAEVAK
jgi:hypothetical protein